MFIWLIYRHRSCWGFICFIWGGMAKVKEELRFYSKELEKVIQGVNENFAKFDSETNKELVLVLGNTDAGKTSLINDMLGGEPDFDDEGRLFFKKEFGEVGKSSVNSQTFLPEALCNPGKSKYIFCDVAGFEDSNGGIKRAVASIATEYAIKKVKVKAIIVVLNYGSMTSDKANTFKKLTETLASLLGSMSIFSGSICFAINRAPDAHPRTHKEYSERVRIKSILKLIDEYKSNIEGKISTLQDEMKPSKDYKKLEELKVDFLKQSNIKKILEFMSSGLEKKVPVFIYDIGKADSRKKIETYIGQANKVIKAGDFNFKGYDPERVSFNEKLNQACKSASRNLERYFSVSQEVVQYEENIERTKSIKEKTKELVNSSGTSEVQGEKTTNVSVEGLETLIADLEKANNEIDVFIAKHDKDITDKEAEKALLETDEIVPITESEYDDYVDDKRMFLFGMFSKTVKKFEYDKEEYEYLKVDKKPDDSARWSHESLQQNPGRYSVTYTSAKGKDGYATLKYLTKKRFKEKDKIDQLKGEVEKLTSDKTDKESECCKKLATKKQNEETIETHQATIKVIKANGKLDGSALDSHKKQCEESLKQYKSELKNLDKVKGELAELSAHLLTKLSKNHGFYETLSRLIVLLEIKGDWAKSFNENFVKYEKLTNSQQQQDENNQQNSKDKNSTDLPEQYVCFLTGQLFRDPVTLTCGDSFERTAIVSKFASVISNGGDQENELLAHCPKCNKEVDAIKLIEAKDLRGSVNGYRKKNKWSKTTEFFGVLFSPSNRLKQYDFLMFVNEPKEEALKNTTKNTIFVYRVEGEKEWLYKIIQPGRDMLVGKLSEKDLVKAFGSEDVFSKLEQNVQNGCYQLEDEQKVNLLEKLTSLHDHVSANDMYLIKDELDSKIEKLKLKLNKAKEKQCKLQKRLEKVDKDEKYRPIISNQETPNDEKKPSIPCQSPKS